MATGTKRIEEILGDARPSGGCAGDACSRAEPQRRQGSPGGRRRPPGAVVLARTDEEPERTPETGTGLRMLDSLDEAVREARLLCHYYSRHKFLHWECFYNGSLGPPERDGAHGLRLTQPQLWPTNDVHLSREQRDSRLIPPRFCPTDGVHLSSTPTRVVSSAAGSSPRSFRTAG